MTKFFVNEESTAFVTITFRDRDGNAVAPTAATYEVDNLTNGTKILTEQPITPIGSTVEIELLPSATRLFDQKNLQETCRVTIKSEYGNGDFFNDQVDYIVRGLSEVP